jgi:hypothetical protein
LSGMENRVERNRILLILGPRNVAGKNSRRSH